MCAFTVGTLRVLGLWLHLVAVVLWIGATVGWMLVLLTGKPSNGAQPGWLEHLGRRVCTVGWEAVFVIILTGIFNLLPRVESGRFFESAYLSPLLMKLILVGGMIGLHLWQHKWLVPKLGSESMGSIDRRRARYSSLVAAVVFLVMAAGVLWLGVSLRY